MPMNVLEVRSASVGEERSHSQRRTGPSREFTSSSMWSAITAIPIITEINYTQSYPGRGLAVNFCKKCGEKKIIFTAYFLHLFAVNVVNRGELFIFTAFSIFLQNVSFTQGFEPPTSCMPSAAYSTAPTVMYYLGISREFKSDWVNVGKHYI